jgi:hypothetical protein
MSTINDPQHWRLLAEEMRTLAEDVKDKIAREMMVRIASDYDKLAKRAQERLRSENSKTDPDVNRSSSSLSDLASSKFLSL